MGNTGSFLSYFGSELRHHRERAGLTQGEVGQRCYCGNGLISKIERAERVPQPELCRSLDELFGTDGFFTRLGAEVREHTSPSARFRAYLDREPDAVAIYTYASLLVPGLLQTEAYARCVIEAVRPALSADVVNTNLATRMTRQEILRRDRPPCLWAILGEAVLYLGVGSDRVMADQLARILDAARTNPEIVVQLLPNSAGPTCAMGVPFLIAEFAEGPPALHLEEPAGVSIVAGEETVNEYALFFDHLRAAALPENMSAEMIERRVKELRER